MELMQLRMLLAAADGESLQKAGQAVGRTPQAVGMAIDKLENELGVSLFHAPAGKGHGNSVIGNTCFWSRKPAGPRSAVTTRMSETLLRE